MTVDGDIPERYRRRMTGLQQPRPTGPQLLQWSIDRSGLSIRRYAADRLLRNERTVSRWLDAETAMPRLVLERLLAEYDAYGIRPLPPQR